MAKSKEDLEQQVELLKQATRRKIIRYVWSGLIMSIIGLLILGLGLHLTKKAYSPESLIVGLGIVIIIIGLIRILIGIINPSVPDEIADTPPTLSEALFSPEREVEEH
jgi:hypothetical protein